MGTHQTQAKRGAANRPGVSEQDDLGPLLLRCRAERNLDLKDVASVVGLSVRGLSNIEQGISRPRRVTRLRIEEFLRKHKYFPKVA